MVNDLCLRCCCVVSVCTPLSVSFLIRFSYLANIGHVDSGIRNITALFEELFDDQATSYVFTSDHGMSNRGSHGDGDPDNTRTPLVAWGAGVRSPQGCSEMAGSVSAGSTDVIIDASPAEWQLQGMCRMDVAQADIAPLLVRDVPP